MGAERSLVWTASRFGRAASVLYRPTPEAQRLLVILPGRRYSADRPVLHYLREGALAAGWDVLSVVWGFQAAQADLSEEDLPDLLAETRRAVERALAGRHREVCFAGKSLGSLVAAALADSEAGIPACALLLTPVEQAMEAMGRAPTLAVLGTADPLHGTVAFARAQGKPNVSWRVFEGLDHSLEVAGDVGRSMSMLPDVVGVCLAFLAR